MRAPVRPNPVAAGVKGMSCPQEAQGSGEPKAGTDEEPRLKRGQGAWTIL